MFGFTYFMAMVSMVVAVILNIIFEGFPLLSAILFWLFYILGYAIVAVDTWQYRKLKRLHA